MKQKGKPDTQENGASEATHIVKKILKVTHRK